MNTQQIDEILKLGTEDNVSDIHLKPGNPPVIRKGGDLIKSDGAILSSQDIEDVVRTLVSDAQYEEYKQNHDCDSAISYGNKRYRMNIYDDINGCNIAIRCLNNSLPAHIEESIPSVLYEAANQRSGLILITGPTGSGKTTTLAALIKHICQTSGRHIVTVEDPVEYVFESDRSIVTQREVGRHTSSFTAALTAVLREDPDVIMLGEMRTPESIQGAITAAETGHLVFATLHTRGAVNSIDRIIDVFQPEKQTLLRVELSMVLIAIVSQQLVPSLSGERTLATEIMLTTDSVKNLIRTGKTQMLASALQTSRSIGMHTMDFCLEELYLQGRISDEVRKTFSYKVYGRQ